MSGSPGELSAVFVSDVHLCPSRMEMAQGFLEFLENLSGEVQSLYILGDLFEYWAGDDDLGDPFNARIAGALRAVSDQGAAVYLLHGNRDFLLGPNFARAAGCVLLPDPTVIRMQGVATLLTHGDTLCTEDADYQAFRVTVRQPAWRQTFLARPLAERKAEIEALRRRSETEKSRKPQQIMDVYPAAVEAALRQHGCTRIIHGHTHRPARHAHNVDGRSCERWVLPDWYRSGGFLRCGQGGCEAVGIKPG